MRRTLRPLSIALSIALAFPFALACAFVAVALAALAVGSAGIVLAVALGAAPPTYLAIALPGLAFCKVSALTLAGR